MNDYLPSFSSYGTQSPYWNPAIPNFSALPSTAETLRLGPGTDYSGQISSFGQGIPGAVGEPSLWDRFTNSGFFSSTNGKTGVTSQGWGAPAFAVGQGLFNAWLGMKQYGLFKDQLAESKRQFGLNYAAQAKTTNTALEDRQRARVASNPGAYQSVGDYMAANRIPGG